GRWWGPVAGPGTAAPVGTTAAGNLDRTAQCSDAAGIAAALALAPAASDNCTATANLITNLVSDVTTPDATCANAYVRVRTWNFSDGCGNSSANFGQTLRVVEMGRAACRAAAGNVERTAQCSDEAGTTAAGNLDRTAQWGDAAGIAVELALAPAASDNCTATANLITNLVSDVTTPDATCANAYVRVRTWNFSDGCGNSSANFGQTLRVV